MKKRITALVLATCMMLSLAACGGTSTTETEDFVVNACIASEPETIDPSLASTVDAAIYTQHQFENLMKYKDSGEAADDSGNVNTWNVDYGQAESYTVSDDELVYTFTLRDDIYWSDGEPVEAEDFVYGWQRTINPENASDYGYILDGIVLNAAAIQAGEKDVSELGIKAVDSKTVEITLESPCAYFIELCSFAALMPLRQDVVEGSDNWTDPANIVVNGPYKITEWVHDSYILMEPNEKYYDYENLGPSQIKWWLSDSETAILSAYQSGEYQFIESFPTDMIESLKESGDCFVDPYIGTYFLYLNCETISDWRVRAAMVLAVDRENIVNNVTQGGQVPATGLVAAGITDSTGTDFSTGVSDLGAMYNTLATLYPDADLSTYEGRCALAKELYQAAVDDGSWDANTTLVYDFNTSDAHKAIAEACGSDWQTVLGMNITLENMEWNTYTTNLSEGNFGIARMGWIADYNDALTYLELFMTDSPYNYGKYNNADYDAALTAAKALQSGADRDSQLYAAEESLFGEGGFPTCPVYYYTQLYCNKTISNIGFTPMGYYFFAYSKPVA